MTIPALNLPFLDLGPVFQNRRVYVCFRKLDWDAAMFLIGEQNDYPLDENSVGCMTCFENGNFAVIADPDRHDTFVDLLDTFSHEACHVMQRTRIGINTDDPDFEVQARLVGTVTGFVVQEYLRQRTGLLCLTV